MLLFMFKSTIPTSSEQEKLNLFLAEIDADYPRFINLSAPDQRAMMIEIATRHQLELNNNILIRIKLAFCIKDALKQYQDSPKTSKKSIGVRRAGLKGILQSHNLNLTEREIDQFLNILSDPKFNSAISYAGSSTQSSRERILQNRRGDMKPVYKIGSLMAIAYVVGLYYPNYFTGLFFGQIGSLVFSEMMNEDPISMESDKERESRVQRNSNKLLTAKALTTAASIFVPSYSQYSPTTLTVAAIPTLEEQYGSSIYLLPPLLTLAFYCGKTYLAYGVRTAHRGFSFAYELGHTFVEAMNEFSHTIHGGDDLASERSESAFRPN